MKQGNEDCLFLIREYVTDESNRKNMSLFRENIFKTFETYESFSKLTPLSQDEIAEGVI